MADYVPPVTLKKFSLNGPHSVSYTVVASHEAANPHVVIFDRVLPAVNAQTGNETHSRYRVRYHRSVQDGDGNPTGKESIVECSVRFPAAAVSTDVDADMLALGVMLSDADFRANVVNELLLPGV